MESLLQSAARGGSHSQKRVLAEVFRLRSPRRCLGGQHAPGWCGAGSCGAGQQPRGTHRGGWEEREVRGGGTKGWRSRGRSGRDLHPPPCPRRGVPAVKSWLHAPASPKRARGFQHPSLCRRARTAVPLAGVICSEGGTHGRDRGTTQQGLEIHGLPGGSGRGGGVTKLHETSRHREKATTHRVPRRTHTHTEHPKARRDHSTRPY